jgi:hypothetical protein
MPRAALVILIAAAFLGFARPAFASPPVITLLSPTNGATIASPAYSTDHTTFSWHVDWDAPEHTIVQWQISSDPNFAPGKGTGENQACTAVDVNCFSSYAPPRSYSPPYPKIFYWRVGLTTSGGTVWSGTSIFQIVDLPDRVKPRVRAYPGSARRGTRGRVRIRAADARGRVRLLVTLEYRGRVLYKGRLGLTETNWGESLFFHTTKPLPRSLPAGRYLLCARAWDEAGNTARSCAPYHVR